MNIELAEKERELTARNIRSLTALFESMARDVPQFIKHVSESMAMSTVAIREANQALADIGRDRRDEQRAARRASDHA